MKIQNMRSSKTGRAVPNQFTVKTTHHYYFQSYDSGEYKLVNLN